MRLAFERWHGQEVDTQGDSFFVVFGNAAEALNCAIGTQQQLACHHWPEGACVRVRMGLHTGEPIHSQVGYTGLDVHRAARIGAIGHGGQVLLSQATCRLVESALPDGASLRDLGRYRLKDIQQAEQVYQLVVPGLQSDFPPLNTPGISLNNLPVPLTSFIGREQEIEQVSKRLAVERLVTLVGAGGCGKTRLSIQAAGGLLPSYPHGVWLVELAPLSDPALVAQQVVKTLNLSEQGQRTPLEILLEFLNGKHLLLVMDNCEHLVDACARLVEELLRQCPDLSVLATSREALGVPGESTFYVPSLSLPARDEALPVEQVKGYEAVRLFQERAGAILSGFQVDESNSAGVARICRRLDGIPLAIELAAARLRMMSVEQVASRLESSFQVLRGGSRTSLPRHQTLRAAIDWSHDLLTQKERVLLRRLSVFSGGWTLEAAEAVCQGQGLDGGEILDLLGGLVSKSMAITLPAPGAELRYTLLETIRLYALEKLRQAGEEAWCLQQHLNHFLDFAETGDRKLHGPESLEWLRRMDVEYNNFHLALEWCFGAGRSGENGVRLTNAVFEFWNRANYYYELHFQMKQALIQSSSMIGTPARAKILYNCGSFESGSFAGWEEGRPLLEESLAAWRELGASYRNDYAYVLSWLGYFLFDEEPKTSRNYLQETVDIFRQTGDWWGLGWALNLFFEIKYYDGEVESATAMAEEALSAFKKSGDRWGIALGIGDVGDLKLMQGNYLEARPYLEEALDIFMEFGSKIMALQFLSLLGHAARGLDEYEQAEAYYRESLAMRQGWGLGKGLLFNPLLDLGYSVLSRGDAEQAVSFFKQALNLGRELDDRYKNIQSLAGFASIATACGNVETAARLYGAVESLFRGMRPEGRSIESQIHPITLREFERYQAICKAQLGEAAYAIAKATGEKLSLDKALSEAMALSRDDGLTNR